MSVQLNGLLSEVALLGQQPAFEGVAAVGTWNALTCLLYLACLLNNCHSAGSLWSRSESQDISGTLSHLFLTLYCTHHSVGTMR